MDLKLLMELEDLKENHKNAYFELRSLRDEGLNEYIKQSKQDFIKYFADIGFSRDNTGHAITMRYKGIKATLTTDNDILRFDMKPGTLNLIRINEVCDESLPTHVSDTMPIEQRINHEKNAIAKLQKLIINFTPCKYFMTIDNQHKQYDTLIEIIEHLVK